MEALDNENINSGSDISDDERRKAQINNEIGNLRMELLDLKETKEKIETAMEKVQSAASSDRLSGTANSFNWIVNNMDTYWSATDSSARDAVKDTLTKVGNECGSSGKLMAQVGPVMNAANEKLDEINTKIENIQNEIDVLSASLLQEMEQ